MVCQKDGCGEGVSRLSETQTRKRRFFKTEKFEEWYSSKPEILEQNTYFWRPFFGRWEYRMKRSIGYAEQVAEWLRLVFGDARVTRDENRVQLDGVEVFYIKSSRSHVYKWQNLRFIKAKAREVEQKEMEEE